MKIELPQVGESVTEGVIGKWLKQIGDTVEKFEPLVEVVTDKVNMEMPSPVTGVLTAIVANEGDTVPMGAIIADIAVEGEPETSASSAIPVVSEAASTPDTTPLSRTGELVKDAAPVGPTGSSGPISADPPAQAEAPASARRRYSPIVLKLAEEHNVDLTRVTGTGINGRITRKDVQGFIDSGDSQASVTAPVIAPAVQTVTPTKPAATPVDTGADEERVALTPVRRMIAEHMVRSASEIPTAWSIQEVDVTNLVKRRAALREEFREREGVNITYLPFVLKAVAESLKENPLLNSSWGGDSVILKKRVNIGVAIAAPNGLVVPVIHDADGLSIAGLAKKIDELTTRARDGKLSLEDVQGGTFTVNNTGTLGSISSQPIINHPQAAILTTESIVKRPVVIDGDAIAIRSMMNICMTFDHRIMDGAESSAFMSAVKRRIEAISAETGIY